MNFQIPQFIEHEPKVIGPLTFKQAAYLGAPLPFIFILWFSLPLSVFLPVAVVLEAIGFAFGFITIGAKSFPEFVVNALHFSASPRTYIWQRGPVSVRSRNVKYEASQKTRGTQEPQFTTESRIGNLAVKVQTKR